MTWATICRWGIMSNPSRAPRVVVFDIGGVFVDWDPENLYRKLIPDDAARAHFLTHVTPPVWNAQQDLGLRSWSEAVEARAALYPEHADLIRAYDERWPEMVAGINHGTVAVQRALRAAGVPVYAITNYSAEKWDLSQQLWPALNDFDGVVVSGRERMLKPDPGIYRLLCRRYGLDAGDCVFIDDLPHNVAGAQTAGMAGILFTTPDALRTELETLMERKIAA